MILPVSAYSRSFLRHIDTWTSICPVGTLSFQASGIGPVGRSYDVFRDGTLLLAHTPGHSRSLFSVMLWGRNGYRILGSDAAYLPESFSEHKIPGFPVNNRLAEKSLDWLIQCKNDPACMDVFVNHDPTVPEGELEVTLLWKFLKLCSSGTACANTPTVRLSRRSGRFWMR